ncbi:MAG: retroviral-like aspartic protease family protein, partial [Candidatus Binatia bacterium]
GRLGGRALKYPLDREAGIILVKTKVYGPKGDAIVNLALDTGATWTLVSWEAAVQLGYDPASVRDRTPVTTGSSVEYCPKINLRRLESLGKSVSNLEALCHTLPPTSRVDGLLGLNFLRRFDVRINYKEGYISVR